MPRSFPTACLRRFRDERGLALPLALGVTLVLSALAAGIFTYVTTNQGAAERSSADQKAYGLAEAGLSYAFSTLTGASDPYSPTSVPSTTVTLPGGSVTYDGTLSGVTWTLTGTAAVPNPSGPNAASVVRTVSAQALVTTTVVPDMSPWDYLFVDQPSGCITMGNSVALDVSLYVRGDLCLENNAQIDSPAVHLFGSLYVNNSAQVGSSGDPIGEFQATGNCHYGGMPVTCGPAAQVYADAIGTSPPSVPKPPVDLVGTYATADLGPLSNCTTGSFPGGFDNDVLLNVSLGSVDLTPASAYDCKKQADVDGDGDLDTVAQIAWTPGSPGTLTVKGTIYIDGDLTWTNLNLLQYRGLAVIYASGQVLIKNRADLCAGVGGACDNTWDPRVDLIVFVAGSLLSETQSTPTGGEIGNHVNFQGAIYVVNDFEMDNNTTIWGPVITRSATISNSAIIHAPTFPIQYMDGMPAGTTTETQVAPITGSYAG